MIKFKNKKIIYNKDVLLLLFAIDNKKIFKLIISINN